MHIVHRTPVIVVVTAPLPDLDADLLVVPVFEDESAPGSAALDEASGGEITRAKARGEFKGKPSDVLVTSLTGWKTRLVALVGLGPVREYTPDRLRRAVAAGAGVARQRRLARVAIVLREEQAGGAHSAQVAAEGAVLANFDGGAYRTVDPPKVWLDMVILRVSALSPEVSAAVERGRVLGECTNIARELANEPGNALPPRVFAERAAAVARVAGLSVEVLDESAIGDLHMGLLMGVARGSQEPPRLVVLRHEPAGVAAHGPVLGLIGKGVTFDTGGISIKPADSMDRMKDDMSGGAAVLAAMAAISRLGAPVRCIGVIPMVENMPGGRAFKPGDVLTSAEGKTVEILNTDAEGRLILGDAVWYARRLGATHLVDVATLTGACMIALGRSTSGLFGTPDTWVEDVRKAGDRAGDRLWPMPVFDDYKEYFKSDIADFANTGGRPAGAITGALFIKEFAADLPWAHLDIAGTAWAEEAKPHQPKGATGVGVRTLVELALAVAAWSGAERPQ